MCPAARSASAGDVRGAAAMMVATLAARGGWGRSITNTRPACEASLTQAW